MTVHDPTSTFQPDGLSSEGLPRKRFAALLAESAGAVQAYLRRHLDRAGDVEDLTQEVFLAALEGADRYRGDARPTTWLLGIARNKLLTFLRDEGRRRLRPGDPVASTLLEAQVERIEEQAETPEQDRRLKDCLEALRPRQRQLVRRFYEEGETAETIARGDGSSAGGVRMTLLRVRTILRRCLERGPDRSGSPRRGPESTT